MYTQHLWHGHKMSSYWEKQKRLKRLVKKFEASKNKYTKSGQLKERHPPSPPMSPFEDLKS